MHAALVLAVVATLYAAFKYISRLHDPDDYLALDVGFEPRISIARFDGFEKYDALSHEAGLFALREFSRHYQSAFLSKADPVAIVSKLARCRRDFVREMHALRMWLPNDAPLERRLLAGIEEADTAMATALAEVAKRYPEVRLAHGAGVLPHPTLRAHDDVWE